MRKQSKISDYINKVQYKRQKQNRKNNLEHVIFFKFRFCLMSVLFTQIASIFVFTNTKIHPERGKSQFICFNYW